MDIIIRIKSFVSVTLLHNGHAKSACVVLVVNPNLCVFHGHTPSQSILIGKFLSVTSHVIQVGRQRQNQFEYAAKGETVTVGFQIGQISRLYEVSNLS